jgi:O-antigen/teichoic acid export membrane protein
MQSIVSKSIHGVIWSAVESFSLQGVQFLIGIVLARLLSPSDFGMIGMLSIFMGVSQVFVDCGFSSALIRQKKVSKEDYGTAFLINFTFSIMAFAILFLIAPFVANFYDTPELKSVMQIFSTVLIVNALFTVHKVKLTRHVDFKTQSKATLCAAIISGAVGITLAYNGFGVWSLVYQAICNSVLSLIFFSLLLKWFPHPIFSRDSFRNLFGFGSKIFLASIMHTIYSNLYNIAIGKKFSASTLGYYTRADQLGQFPSQNIAGVLSRVTYPILSQLQDNQNQLKIIYTKYLQICCFVVFPLMMGLAALANPIITLLFGEKWLPSAILLQILCFGLMFDPICNINLNLLLVKGRSDLFLKLEVVKKTIAILILIVSLPFGLIGICSGRVLYGIIATLLNMTYTNNFIDLSMRKQIRLLLPSLIFSLIMAAGVYAITQTYLNGGLQLVAGIVTGLILYLVPAWIFKVEALMYILNVIKKKK